MTQHNTAQVPAQAPFNGLQLEPDGAGGFLLPSLGQPPTNSPGNPLDGLQLEPDGEGGFLLPDLAPQQPQQPPRSQRKSFEELNTLRQQLVQQPVGRNKDESIFDKIGESITGRQRTTKEIESLDELGLNTPELQSFSGSALKTLAGLATTGDTVRIKRILQQQFPNANLRKDAKGNDIVDFPSGSYALNKPGFSNSDLARVFIDLAAFSAGGVAFGASKVLAGGAGLLRRSAAVGGASAATDATLQNINKAVGGGDVNVGDVVVSGLTGGLGQFVPDVIGDVARGRRGSISPQNQEIIRASEKEGIDVFTTDLVTGPTSISIDRVARNLFAAGSGRRRSQQARRRVEVIEEIESKLSKVTPTVVFKSLSENINSRKAAAGAFIQKIKDEMDQVSPINVGSVREKIDDALITLNVRSQKDTPAIKELLRLKALFKVDRPDRPVGLNRARREEFLFSDLHRQRNTTAGNIEKFIPGGSKKFSSFGRSQLLNVEKEMGIVLRQFVKDNVQPAQALRGVSRSKQRSNIARQYDASNQVWGNEFKRLSQSRIKSALANGDVDPEKITALLINSNKSESAALFRRLDSQGRENVRASLTLSAIRGSIKEGKPDPQVFARNIALSLSKNPLFFSSSQSGKLRGLVKLLEATKRANVNAVVSAGVDRLAVSAALWSTFVPALTVGGIAKLFDTKPVRDFLLKLNNTPRSQLATSRELDRLAKIANPFIQDAVRQNRESLERDQQGRVVLPPR